MSSITIYFKSQSSQLKHKHSITNDVLETLTIADLKNIAKQKTNLSDSVRLVSASGKVLQPDEALFSTFEISNETIIFVTKQHQPSTQANSPVTRQPASSAFGIPDEFAGMMNNPMIEAMMSSPEFIESMIQTNPQLQQLMRDHPEARDAIRDPAFMRQQMEAMRNPRLMQEMMRNQDRQLSNIEAHPGGFNLLTSAFSGLTGPQETSDTSTEEVNRRFAEALGVSPRSENLQGPNEEALPNPWAPPNQQTGRFAPSSPQQNPMSFLNMFGNLPQPNIQPNTQRTPSTTGAATPAATPASIDFANLMGMRSPNATQTGSVPAQMPPDLNLLFQMMQNRQQPSLNPNVPAAPFTFPYNFSQMAPSNTQPVPTPSSQTATYVPSEESKNKYSKELKELKEMGFEQVDKNVRALLASAGDVQGAVEYLLRL